MRMQFQSEETPEKRYDAETVRRATVLAARLQEQHGETLSQSDAASLAEELGIDPRHMVRALEMVSREQQQQEERQQVRTLPRPGAAKKLIAVGVAAMLGLFMLRWTAAEIVRAPEMAMPAPPAAAVAPKLVTPTAPPPVDGSRSVLPPSN
jgi:hypothetical protein